MGSGTVTEQMNLRSTCRVSHISTQAPNLSSTKRNTPKRGRTLARKLDPEKARDHHPARWTRHFQQLATRPPTLHEQPDPEPNTFEADQGMAVFDSETQSFWVSPKPKDKRGVLYDELASENKKKFDASRFKEIDNLLKLGALIVMSVKDSEHFGKAAPANIIPTNMLDKWKSQDDGRYGEGKEQHCSGRLESSTGLPIGTRSTTDEIGRLNQMKQTHRFNR